MSAERASWSSLLRVNLHLDNAIVVRRVDASMTARRLNRETFMYFLALGIALLGMKWFEVGMVAEWSWWLVLTPFAAAAAWWSFADWSGYYKRVEARKMEKRKQERIEKKRAALSVSNKKR